jgi:ribonuclease HI
MEDMKENEGKKGRKDNKNRISGVTGEDATEIKEENTITRGIHTHVQIQGSAPNHKFLTGIQYILNSAVLFAREHIKAGGKLGEIAAYICKSTIERIARVAPATITRAVFPHSTFSDEEITKYAKKITKFGASGKRTEEQKLAAAAFTENTVNKLPTNSLQVWTDGSKLGKGSKGPTGAGAMIIPTGAADATHNLIYHLGESTNQAAELWAIGGALETIKGLTLAPATEIHIFSDSDFSLKCLKGVYNSKIHYNIIKHIINLMDYFPRKTVHLHHVAGHAGIPGNDIADELANKGAQRSKQSTSILDLPDIVKTYGFNYQLVRDGHYGDVPGSNSNNNSCHFTSYM